MFKRAVTIFMVLAMVAITCMPAILVVYGEDGYYGEEHLHASPDEATAKEAEYKVRQNVFEGVVPLASCPACGGGMNIYGPWRCPGAVDCGVVGYSHICWDAAGCGYRGGISQCSCTAHTHSWSWVHITNATCTTAAVERERCSCGATRNSRPTTAARGHEFEEWFVEEAVTATENGNERRNCNRTASGVFDACNHFERRTLYRVIYNNVIDEFTFPLADGELLQGILSGENAAPPDIDRLSICGRRIWPGWDDGGYNITGARYIEASPLGDEHIRKHEVVFDLYNGSISGEHAGGGSLVQNIEHTMDAVLPYVNDPYGHTFTGWGSGREHVCILEPTLITAQYVPDPFYVIFLNYDGTEHDRQVVYFGSSGRMPDYDPVKYAHAFVGWERSDFTIRHAKNLMVRPIFAIHVFNVAFLNHDSRIIDTQRVSYGSGATAPDAPGRSGFEFVGWDEDFEYISSDLTVTAQFRALPPTADDHGGDMCHYLGCDETDVLCEECGRCDEHCGYRTDDESGYNTVNEDNAKCEHCNMFEEHCICEEIPPFAAAGGDDRSRTIAARETPLGTPPLFTFMGRNIYLFVPLHIASWSIVNLLLIALGAVFVIIKLLQKRKNACEAAAEEQKQGKRKWLLPASIFGAIAIGLFLVMQDMAALIALLDTWTIAHMAIFIIQIICIKAYNKK